MAKGAVSKEIFFNKLLEIFPDSFMYNNGKECRIPMTEDGDIIQLKITATCAKTNVSNEIEKDFFDNANTSTIDINVNAGAPPEGFSTQPSAEEKEKVAELLKQLGLAPA